MPLYGPENDAVKMGLSGLNMGVNAGVVNNTAVSGANTFATFRQRVLNNIQAAGVGVENAQAGFELCLRGLDIGNNLGILTDTNLNSKTTVAQVQALFTAQDPRLPAAYTGSAPQ